MSLGRAPFWDWNYVGELDIRRLKKNIRDVALVKFIQRGESGDTQQGRAFIPISFHHTQQTSILTALILEEFQDRPPNLIIMIVIHEKIVISTFDGKPLGIRDAFFDCFTCFDIYCLIIRALLCWVSKKVIQQKEKEKDVRER